MVTTILGKKHKPIAQDKANLSENTLSDSSDENEPIYILGVITDQVTIPTMDGTRGGALYKIPFRLSRKPSSSWSEFFLQSWNMPPSFTSMHRPGIASVYGDKIILDGTTIEEVRDYHRKTLVLCVEEANKKEQELLEKQRLQIELEEQRKGQHFSNVVKIAENMQF